MDYALIDSGNFQKLERFGAYRIIRPCAVAVWEPCLTKSWITYDALFERSSERYAWKKKDIPAEWCINFLGVKLLVFPTDFGHLGVFPEHAMLWPEIEKGIDLVKQKTQKARLLNLFAYTGAATLKAAQCGAELCHVDASAGMIDTARKNAAINGLADAPIRWIVDDVVKFCKREIRRGKKYDGIILDPPSFGRGASKEVFKIEEMIGELLALCKELLTPEASFMVFSCHTPGFTPVVLENLVKTYFDVNTRRFFLKKGELLLTSSDATYPLPAGSYISCFFVR